jgi:hypothetical protein
MFPSRRGIYGDVNVVLVSVDVVRLAQLVLQDWSEVLVGVDVSIKARLDGRHECPEVQIPVCDPPAIQSGDINGESTIVPAPIAMLRVERRTHIDTSKSLPGADILVDAKAEAVHHERLHLSPDAKVKHQFNAINSTRYEQHERPSRARALTRFAL